MNNRPYEIGKGWITNNSTTNLTDNSIISDTIDDNVTQSSTSPIHQSAVYSTDISDPNGNHSIPHANSPFNGTTTLSNKKINHKRSSRIAPTPEPAPYRGDSNNLTGDINDDKSVNGNDYNNMNDFSVIIIELPPGSFHYILGITSTTSRNKDNSNQINNYPIYLIVQYRNIISSSSRRPTEVTVLLSRTVPVEFNKYQVQLLSPLLISQLAKLGIPGTLITTLAAINASNIDVHQNEATKPDLNTSFTSTTSNTKTESSSIINLVSSVRDLSIQSLTNKDTVPKRNAKGSSNKRDKGVIENDNLVWKLDLVHDTWIKEPLNLQNLHFATQDNLISEKNSSIKVNEVKDSRGRNNNLQSSLRIETSPIRTTLSETTATHSVVPESIREPATVTKPFALRQQSNPASLPPTFATLKTPNEEKSSTVFPFPSPSSHMNNNMIIESMTNAGVNPSDLTYSFTVPAASVPYFGVPVIPMSSGSSGGIPSMNMLPTTTTSTSSATPPYSFAKWNSSRNSNRHSGSTSDNLSSPSSPPSTLHVMQSQSQLSTPTTLTNNFFSASVVTTQPSIPNNPKLIDVVSIKPTTSTMMTTSPENFIFPSNTFTIPSLSIAPEENNTFVIPANTTTSTSTFGSSNPGNSTSESETTPSHVSNTGNSILSNINTSSLQQISRSLRTKRQAKQLEISTSNLMISPSVGDTNAAVGSPTDQSSMIVPRIIPDLLSSRSNSGYAFTIPADNKGASSTFNPKDSLNSNYKLTISSLDSNGVPFLFSNGNMSLTTTDLSNFPELSGNTPNNNNTTSITSTLLPKSPRFTAQNSNISRVGNKQMGGATKFMFDDMSLQDTTKE